MNSIDDLARQLFEAYEGEKSTRGDFTTRDPYDKRDCGGRPRRWTELGINEQDCWLAAARAATRLLPVPLPSTVPKHAFGCDCDGCEHFRAEHGS